MNRGLRRAMLDTEQHVRWIVMVMTVDKTLQRVLFQFTLPLIDLA